MKTWSLNKFAEGSDETNETNETDETSGNLREFEDQIWVAILSSDQNLVQLNGNDFVNVPAQKGQKFAILTGISGPVYISTDGVFIPKSNSEITYMHNSEI